MKTPQWIKKLGGHAGELFVSAELSKRGIPNALLPENFSDDDILVGDKEAKETAFVQVKACHPDRSTTFILNANAEQWADAGANRFVVFVWLGSPRTNESPVYWLATKREVGELCRRHPAHGTDNWERRFARSGFPSEWQNRWSLFDSFRPSRQDVATEK
jgi:hypothetical protein